jgi:DNA primase
MPAWINFKELRKQLLFADVLRHYKIDYKQKGDRTLTLCPLPGHSHRTDGKPRTASLSINFTRNIFRCFGCNQSGNAVEFACRMEGFDPSKTDQFRQAAVKICELFKINAKGLGGDLKPEQVTHVPESVPNHSPVVNAPLDFELKDLDAEHPYLLERKFLPRTIQYFGLGYCNRGLMKGRVAIPLHDMTRLVGYAGRVTKDEEISDECPKYRFPGSRLSKGIQHEFHKSLLLYNLNRVGKNLRDIIVVEGFASTWWLTQCGWPHVVALMGNSCSEEQAKLVVQATKPDARVWAMPDGNEAGIQCAHSIFEQVAPHRLVRWIRLAPDEQPTDISAGELPTLFES